MLLDQLITWNQDMASKWQKYLKDDCYCKRNESSRETTQLTIIIYRSFVQVACWDLGRTNSVPHRLDVGTVCSLLQGIFKGDFQRDFQGYNTGGLQPLFIATESQGFRKPQLDSSPIQKQSPNPKRSGRSVLRYNCRSTQRSTNPSTRSTVFN